MVATPSSGIGLQLLGAMQAVRGDRSLTFRTRKALALLAYLAVEGGTHRREELADLLWPGPDAEAGRASLRTALFYVRDALGGQAEPVLSTTREQVGVREDAPLHLDVGDLARALRLLRDAGGAAGVARLVGGAVDRYRGPFLAGVTFPDAPDFETWVEVQRAHWLNVASELLGGQAGVHAEAGDWASAVTALERLTIWNPADETGWRRLLEAHLRRDDVSAARRTWRAYQSTVADLDAPASAEMLRLAERIPPRERGRPAFVTGALDDAGESLQQSAPFVGRVPEWSCLHTAFERSRAGRTELVVLAGAAGTGKTRLAAEFVSSARRAGADALVGRALEVSGELPYAAPAGALRARLEAENAPEDLLSDVWLSELARLLPELRERYPDLAQPGGDPTLQPTLLFEAVARLGQALARRKPLVLWLDDVQWAGAATRDLLRYAVRRWSETGTRMLVLLSAGAEDLEADGGLRRWLAGMERDARAWWLEIRALERDDLVHLAEGALRFWPVDGSSRSVDAGPLPDGAGGRTACAPAPRHRRPHLVPDPGARRRSWPQPPRGRNPSANREADDVRAGSRT